MLKYQINGESSEDTYASASNLPDAIRTAREVAVQIPLGEVVCIEFEGKVVASFVRSAAGEIVEQLPTKPADRAIALPGFDAA